ncbi:hypothetical protein H9P43_007855 [Blastocladiella emersonii ATCC 22665]|nr:hypothetical protein H9P43_007855 [Blastocladiella emersonii ATCC 22665]
MSSTPSGLPAHPASRANSPARSDRSGAPSAASAARGPSPGSSTSAARRPRPVSGGGFDGLLGRSTATPTATASMRTAPATTAAGGGDGGLAGQLGKAKAQVMVLRKALLEERDRSSSLRALADEKDALVRAHAQKLDAAQFHAAALTRRVEQLQREVQAAGTSAASAARPASRTSSIASWFAGGGGSSRASPSPQPPAADAEVRVQALEAELARRIAENESLQSRLDDVQARAGDAEREVTERTRRAEEEVKAAKARVAEMEAQIADRQRLFGEVAGMADRIAKLNAEVRQKDDAVAAANKEAAEARGAVAETARAFVTSSRFTQLCQRAAAELESALEAQALRTLRGYADVVSQQLGYAPEAEFDALVKLYDVLGKVPRASESRAGKSKYLEAFLAAYIDLTKVDGTDASVPQKLLAQVQRRKWDPETTNALLGQLAARLQLMSAKQPALHVACARVQDLVRVLGEDYVLYQQVNQAMAAGSADKTSADLAGMQDGIKLVLSISAYQSRTIDKLRKRPSTADASTQLAPHDLAPVESTGTQTRAKALVHSSVQATTATTTATAQTDGKQRFWADSSLRPVTPRSASTSTSVVDEGEEEPADEVRTVKLPPGAAENDVKLLRAHYVKVVAKLTRAVQVAEARANRAEIAAARRASAVGVSPSPPASPTPQHAEPEPAVDDEDAGELRAKADALQAELDAARDEKRDVEASYTAQMQMLTEEMCRLQELVAGKQD